jgi:radical SAM protein with 4Fe4S-binding SPASM domain
LATQPPTPTPSREVDALIVEVTPCCNHDCLHCYNAWKNAAPYPAGGGELGTAELLALLDRVLDETGVNEVTFTGGEPLLRPDLVQLVDHLVARGTAVDLITNGTLLDAAMIERLTPDRIGSWELPLLSADAAIHDELSGQQGAFDKVTLAIAELKLREQPVVAVFVATQLNLPTLRESVELAFALGVDALMFNRFNPGGRGFDNLERLQCTPTQLRAALDELDGLSRELELPVSCSIAMPPCLFDHARWPALSFGFCAAGTAEAYYTIGPLGELRPCNHSTTVLGDLRERGFWELVDAGAMGAFMAARPGFCDGCGTAEICLGGCKAAAEVCYGDLSALEPFLAAFRGEVDKR